LNDGGIFAVGIALGIGLSVLSGVVRKRLPSRRVLSTPEPVTVTAVPAIPEPTAQLPPAPAPEPEPPTQAEAPAATPAERLQQLLQPLSDAYDAAPLPADLWNYPVFLEAVAALKDLRVSLDLLTRYATGSHTAASCAAFAAIGARPDLDEAVAHLYGRTENLGLWAMWECH
jgi:hypothetical protein